MAQNDVKFAELKNDVVSLSNKIDSLTNNINSLTNNINSKKSDKEGPTDKEKSTLQDWIKNISLVLGIPGLILALIIQLNQAKNGDASIGKIEAETEQIQLSNLRQKTEIVLDTLLNLKTKNINEYKTILNNELPKLRATISQLERVKVQRQSQNIIFKYILLWIVFSALGLLFSLVSTFWHSLINLLVRFLYTKASNISNENSTNQRSWKIYEMNKKKEKRIRFLADYSTLILSPIPNILELFIRIALFISLLIPIFNETAIILGSKINFYDIVENTKHWNFSKILAQLKSILFS